MNIPVIKGISPQLACGRKTVRRTSCHLCRPVFSIQLKQPGTCPRVRAVHGNINRDISDNADILFIGICFQLIPLLVELKLHIFLEFNVVIKFSSVVIKGILPAEADILCPFTPGLSPESLFHRHKQRIVLQPVAFLCLKSDKILIFSDITSLISFSQKCKTPLIYFCIINAVLISTKINRITFLFCKDSFLHKCLQADKIWISGKCGKRLIRRISVAGGAQRKNLPAALTSLL